MTVAQLFKRMPKCLVGSYDALRHKTPTDFAALAEHELDLFQEGEDTDIRNERDRLACVKFLQLCRSLESSS